MRNSNMEPDPGHNHRGDYVEQELLSQFHASKQDRWSRPSLTIAEAARLYEVSASTIRRYLAAGRFPTPTSSQAPSHPIQTLKGALGALQAQHAALAPNPDRAASSPAPPSNVTYTAAPAPGPACCPWCGSDGRPSANSARRRRRRLSDGRSAGSGHQSGAGSTAPSIYQ